MINLFNIKIFVLFNVNFLFYLDSLLFVLRIYVNIIFKLQAKITK
jgi:hypothetical protein